MASPVAMIKYTIAGAFKKEIPKSAFDLANSTITFPEIPIKATSDPVITKLEYKAETRKLSITVQNAIPEMQMSGNFDLKVWLVPRGSQIDKPTDNTVEPDRGLIWQSFPVTISSWMQTTVTIDLPEGVALSMHLIYFERIAKTSEPYRVCRRLFHLS